MRKRILVVVVSGNLLWSASVLARTQDDASLRSGGLFDSLVQSIQFFVDDPTIPNFVNIVATVFNDSTAPSEAENLLRELENKPDGSYAITQDSAEAAKVQAVRDNVQNATLGAEAQNRLRQTSQNAQATVSGSIALSDDSQGADATQQIMQNVSGQIADTNELLGTVVQQNQQHQVDRAVLTSLAAEMTEQLAAEATRERRQYSATASATASGYGFIRLAGLAEGEE